MRRPTFVLFGFALFVFSLSGALQAEPHTLALDPGSTEISFLLGATGHDVHGVLHLAEGQLGFDPEKGTAWGEMAIDARRAASGHAKRDKTMHRKVLDSDAHPLITFRAERLDGAVALDGDSTFRIIGTVTLLGVEHPLELPVEAHITGDRVDATATFPVPYVDWGLHNPSMVVLRVAKSVDVTVHARGTLASSGDLENVQPTAATRP